MLSNFRTGGAETQYGNLISNIDRNMFEPVLGLIEYKGNVPSNKFIKRFGKVESHHFVRKNKFDLGVILSIIKYAKNNNVDLIQSQLFMDNQIARFVGLISGLPVITSVRGEIGPLIGLRKMWFEKKSQILSNKIVVNSQWLSKYLQSYGTDHRKIVVIHNGVNYSRLDCATNRQDLRLKYDIPEGNKVITIVARLHAMKDHITFLESFHRMLDKCPNITALIVGDGEERASLEIYSIRLHLDDAVKFLGNIDEEINEVYRISDLLMLTSEYGESFPNVILEAMSANVPIVASNISAISEIIDDNVNGFLVESKDVENFTSRAISVLNDRNLSDRLVLEGGKKVEAFSIPVMVSKYEHLYQKLLANSRCRKKYI